MERFRASAVAATAVLTVGLAMMVHEFAHVLAGWLAGGVPTLITATEVRGDFRSLSPAGLVLLGLSGSAVNVAFAALGWWGLRPDTKTAEATLAAWFCFAVNGCLVTTKMMGEAAAGWGDWMTALRPLPGTIVLRALVATLGTLGVVWMVRRSGAALAAILPAGEPARRVTAARRAAVPRRRARPFLPLAFATRVAGRLPARAAGPGRAGGRWWYLAAAATVAILWLVVGPGLPLSRALL